MSLINGKQISPNTVTSTQALVDSSATALVDIADAQTISGAKTFSAQVTIPLTPTATTSAASKSYVDGSVNVPTTSNKNMVALATTADGQLATSTTLAFTPAVGGYIEVTVNGIQVDVANGNGQRTTYPAYFSVDGGATARAFSAIVAGDSLYWNGSVMGFQLAGTDRFDFDYDVSANGAGTAVLVPGVALARSVNTLNVLVDGTTISVNAANQLQTTGSDWTGIPLTSLNTTPPSTSTITTTADLSQTGTGLLSVGYALRYKSNAGFGYGIITGLTGSTITIAGAALDTVNALTELDFGAQGLVRTMTLMVAGTFQSGGADAAMLQNQMKTFAQWTMTKAYLVRFQVRVFAQDTGGTQPKVNVAIAGNAVGTGNSNAGLAVAAGSWTSTIVAGAPTVGGVNTANYTANMGDSIELKTDNSGANANANNLTVLATFVMDN